MSNTRNYVGSDVCLNYQTEKKLIFICVCVCVCGKTNKVVELNARKLSQEFVK